MVLRHVDDEVELVGSNHVHDVVLTFLVRPADGRSLNAVVVEELGSTTSSEDLIPLLDEVLGRLQQADLTLGAT